MSRMRPQGLDLPTWLYLWLFGLVLGLPLLVGLVAAAWSIGVCR